MSTIVAPVLESTLPPLLVVAWSDPMIDALGFDPRANYVETFWLSLLGPTSTWLMRRFATEFDSHPDGFSLDTSETARAIGIGHRGGRSGPFQRSVLRCVRFGLIREEDHGILAVRTKVPPLTRAQVGRLPLELRDVHDRWEGQQRQTSTHPANEAHAARLARSLLDVGASPTEVADALHRWNFAPEAARRALIEATVS